VDLEGETVISYDARKTGKRKYASTSRKQLAGSSNLTAFLSITAAVSLEMCSLALSLIE